METMERIVTHLLAFLLAVASYLASAATAVAQPALWEVKGPHATVYLFGSVHVLKKDKPWRTAKIDAAIAQCGSLWLEIPNTDDAAAMQALAKKYGIDEAHPLSTKLSKEELAKLDAAAKKAGIPAGEAALEPLRPWMAAITLSTLPVMQAGYDLKSGVENVLKPEFQKADKPVHGFETAEEQIRYFAEMPEKAEVEYLVNGLDEFDRGVEILNTLVGDWYAGDVDGVDKTLDAELRTKYPDVYQLLIVHRNEGFARQIESLLKGDGTVFVAVGAGHLAGPDSVQKMLEAAGYEVERQ